MAARLQKVFVQSPDARAGAAALGTFLVPAAAPDAFIDSRVNALYGHGYPWHAYDCDEAGNVLVEETAGAPEGAPL